MNTTDLTRYSKAHYTTGRGFIVRALWYVINYTVFVSPFLPLNALKRLILRIFGAKIGKGVVIKPCVNIKYPWHLTIGNNTWIGEGVHIDNLADVTIGANCCLSQDALIETGNHNYKRSDFCLITSPVTLEDGVWLCARSVVTGGTICRSHSVLASASLASTELLPYSIYKGVPAVKIRNREIND